MKKGHRIHNKWYKEIWWWVQEKFNVPPRNKSQNPKEKTKEL